MENAQKHDLSTDLEGLSDKQLAEVKDFVAFLRLRTQHAEETLELSRASEAVLATDWLSPEDDEAWADL